MSEHYIDYLGDSDEEPDDVSWTQKDLWKYWTRLLSAVHSTGGYIWTLKYKTLLSRLVKTYGITHVADMMEYWIRTSKVREATSFALFYTNAAVVSSKVNNEQKDWKWDG